jgi:hypothetical protein
VAQLHLVKHQILEAAAGSLLGTGPTRPAGGSTAFPASARLSQWRWLPMCPTLRPSSPVATWPLESALFQSRTRAAARTGSAASQNMATFGTVGLLWIGRQTLCSWYPKVSVAPKISPGSALTRTSKRQFDLPSDHIQKHYRRRTGAISGFTNMRLRHEEARTSAWRRSFSVRHPTCFTRCPSPRARRTTREIPHCRSVPGQGTARLRR